MRLHLIKLVILLQFLYFAKFFPFQIYSSHFEAGFIETDGSCIDINECELEDSCSNQATCHNLPGSYHCECNEGLIHKNKIISSH